MSDRIRQAVSLKHAIDEMAARYGTSLLRQGLYATDTVKWERANRAANRQYRALMRLTSALTELAVEVTR